MSVTKSPPLLVDEAMAQVRTDTVAPVLQRLSTRWQLPSVQRVEMRDPRDVQDGSALNALPAPRGLLQRWDDPALPYHTAFFADDSKGFILCCTVGWRSALATKTLQDMGMTNVAHLEGGFTAWGAQGGPAETLEQQNARRVAQA